MIRDRNRCFKRWPLAASVAALRAREDPGWTPSFAREGVV